MKLQKLQIFSLKNHKRQKKFFEKTFRNSSKLLQYSASAIIKRKSGTVEFFSETEIFEVLQQLFESSAYSSKVKDISLHRYAKIVPLLASRDSKNISHLIRMAMQDLRKKAGN